MDALEMLAEQLWLPAHAEDVRVLVDPSPQERAEAGWSTREEYLVLPDRRAPRILLPIAPPAVRRGALTHYRGLRRRSANVLRGALGALASTSVPLSRTRLVVQARGTDVELPLEALARTLDSGPLHATFGVRTGANRKATLQLLSDTGAPLGYAKLGWNTTADEYVRGEAAALAAVGGRPAAMRAPGLLASFEQGGRPVVVVEPLPAQVRGVRGQVAAPSAAETFALAPVVRRDRAAGTSHLQALAGRLSALRTDADGEARPALDAAHRLLTRVLADEQEVPVQERWHGDLTPWNCAREPDGQLWAWDWESSEEDVVAGLDAVHWHFSVAREAGHLARLRLADCLESARATLHAAGAPASAHALVGALYLLTVVERAATLAAREGGWQRVWISPGRLLELTSEAELLLG